MPGNVTDTQNYAAMLKSPQAPALQAVGNEIYMYTSDGWVSLQGPPGADGSLLVFEQATQPASSTVGALWIQP